MSDIGFPEFQPGTSSPRLSARSAAPTADKRAAGTVPLAAAGRRIPVFDGEVHQEVDAAIKVLSNPAIGIYARGDELVRVVEHKAPSSTLSVSKQGQNIRRPAGAVTITSVNEAALVEALTRYARFERLKGRSDKYVACNCPREVAQMIIAGRGHGWGPIPRLKAVIAAPTLRPDGSVLNQPGLDQETGLFLVGDRLCRNMPEKPNKADAHAALDVLTEPLASFPFVDKADNADLAAAVALLISAVMRPALRAVPAFMVTAPAAGTGKSLLVDIAAILATGRTAAVVTPTPDEAELEKRIGAAAIAGDQVISLDNVTHPLRSDQLCQMLTQDEVQVRVLGASKNVRIPSTSLICFTGNNLVLHGDLNRRTIRIRLDAGCEKPDERRFDVDVIALALSKRDELVTAALTIVRAYILASDKTPAAPMGSFEDWSGTVRSALLWLNFGDCRGDIDAMRAEDPEKAGLAETIANLPTFEFTARDIAQKVTADKSLQEVFEPFIRSGGVFSTKKFGQYLRKHAGMIVGGRKIVHVSTNNMGAIWQVQGESGPITTVTDW